MPKKILTTPSLFRRMIAFVIDLFLLNIFVASHFKSIMLQYMSEGESISSALKLFEANPSAVKEMSIILFFISFLSLAYFAFMEWKLGQTLGQMLMNLRVQGRVRKLKFWQGVVSNVFILPFFPFFLLWVIDPLFIFFKGYRLSENIAGTKLVQEFTI